MLTALDRELAVYCAHSTLDTHYTSRKKTPVPRLNELCAFLQVQKPSRAMGSHNNITDGELSGTSRNLPIISWGLK